MEYTLENEILRVTVASRGAELVSVVDKRTGAEMLWQADPDVWPRHAPILFPYTGRLKGGRFTHRGVAYEGGQHGFARDMEHTLMESAPARLVLRLEANALTMEKFPFAFWLEAEYTLEGSAVRHKLTVHNDSDEEMPFGIGYHPGFACPFDDAHQAGDYVLRFAQPETPEVVECGEDDGLVTGNKHIYFTGQQDIPLTDQLRHPQLGGKGYGPGRHRGHRRLPLCAGVERQGPPALCVHRALAQPARRPRRGRRVGGKARRRHPGPRRGLELRPGHALQPLN